MITQDTKQFEWMMEKSPQAKELYNSIVKKDIEMACFAAIKLYRIGYNEQELREFFLGALSMMEQKVS